MNRPTKIDLLNGITISFVNGRDGSVVEINMDGTKKKLSNIEINNLIDGLMAARQWFKVWR